MLKKSSSRRVICTLHMCKVEVSPAVYSNIAVEVTPII